MDKITPEGLRTLKLFAPTCTNNSAMMAGIKIIESDVVNSLNPFKALFEKGNPVDVETILMHFAGPDHFKQINEEGTIVAVEIPVRLRAFAHVALPLENGVYTNQDVSLPIRNLITIGHEIDGPTWCHLAGCFHVPGSEKLVDKVKAIQAKIPGFLDIGREIEKAGGLDYANYPRLVAETKKAIRSVAT